MTFGEMRAALQIALDDALPTTPVRFRDNDFDDFESEEVEPPLPHLEAALLPNRPINDEYGKGHREVALFQVTICTRRGEGPGEADDLAETLRQTFFRTATFVEGDTHVVVDETPQIMPGYRDGDAWRVPVSISVYANNF